MIADVKARAAVSPSACCCVAWRTTVNAVQVAGALGLEGARVAKQACTVVDVAAELRDFVAVNTASPQDADVLPPRSAFESAGELPLFHRVVRHGRREVAAAAGLSVRRRGRLWPPPLVSQEPAAAASHLCPPAMCLPAADAAPAAGVSVAAWRYHGACASRCAGCALVLHVIKAAPSWSVKQMHLRRAPLRRPTFAGHRPKLRVL